MVSQSDEQSRRLPNEAKLRSAEQTPRQFVEQHKQVNSSKKHQMQAYPHPTHININNNINVSLNVQNLVDGSPIGLQLDPPQQIKVVMLTSQEAEQEATVVK